MRSLGKALRHSLIRSNMFVNCSSWQFLELNFGLSLESKITQYLSQIIYICFVFVMEFKVTLILTWRWLRILKVFILLSGPFNFFKIVRLSWICLGICILWRMDFNFCQTFSNRKYYINKFLKVIINFSFVKNKCINICNYKFHRINCFNKLEVGRYVQRCIKGN